MKIIKRDGRIVEYDSEKIATAIRKANVEVSIPERATEKDIKNIIKYIEKLEKKRILVEDIQDIIEEKLMGIGKFKLAKKYIVYRYTRTLVRKQNTTDQSILGVIRNEKEEFRKENLDKSTMEASIQRDYIASEVSKDLTKRLLLPEKIVKADEEGVLHFHDSEYFVQPVFNSCLIDIKDMLENGTVINGKLIESPKSFPVACIVMTQIIAATASNQYGGISVEIKHLGKYLRKSYAKCKRKLQQQFRGRLAEDTIDKLVDDRVKAELKAGVQTIQYQINTLITTSGKAPFVTLFLQLDENDTYAKENEKIVEEILKQRTEGIKNDQGIYETPAFPKLIYVLDENNCLNGGKYDYLTKLAIKCSIKRRYPDYISAKKMRENYEGNVFSPMGSRNFLSPWKDENGKYKFEGRFNQGVVSINLPQVAIVSKGDENEFWKVLDERLELCKEALMCRHYALLGTTADTSPIHWRYGAIARLGHNEKIDKLLYGGYSTMSLGYIGVYETTKIMTGESHTSDEGKKFALKLVKHLKSKTEQWKKETNIGFELYGTPAKNLCYNFAKIDKNKFGSIKDVTDKGYYTNSYHVDIREKIDALEKLEFESEFQDLTLGGSISYVEMLNMNKNPNSLEATIRFIYDNIQYAELSPNLEDYYVCGYDGNI